MTPEEINAKRAFCDECGDEPVAHLREYKLTVYMELCADHTKECVADVIKKLSDSSARLNYWVIEEV